MSHRLNTILLSLFMLLRPVLWSQSDSLIQANEGLDDLERIIDSFVEPSDLQNYDKKAYEKVLEAFGHLELIDDLNKTIPNHSLLKVQKDLAKAIEFILLAIKEADSEPSPSESDTLQDLQNDLEKLNDLQDRQDELNQKMGEAAASGQKGSPNLDLAKEQEEIRNELNDLREQRYSRTGKLGDVGKIDQAGREMKEGSQDLKRDQPREAQPHGDLASDALGKAISEVEEELSQMAADMVDRLTQEAGELSEAQGRLRGKTNDAQGGAGEKLRQEQESLNDGIEKLLEKMEALAPTLNNFEQRASEQLQKLSRDAKSGNIEKSGKRASNSLLYDAFDQAQKEQGKVEKELGDLGQGLQSLEDQLRYGDSAGLVDFAKRLKEMAEEGLGMGEEEFRQANEEAANALGNLPNADSDERLLNLTRMFEQSAIAEDLNNGRSLSVGAVQQASQLIEQFFWQQAVQEKLRRNNQNTRAPTRYRKQVEEYFRRIAEGN